MGKFAYIAPQIEFSVFDHPEDKPSIEVFFVGCKKRCQGCHNVYLWEVTPYNSIRMYPGQLLQKLLNISHSFPWVKSLILLGGEPLLYREFLEEFLPEASKYFEIVLYTGYEEEEIDWTWKGWDYITWVKVGAYHKTKPSKGKLASFNQKFIKLKGDSHENKG